MTHDRFAQIRALIELAGEASVNRCASYGYERDRILAQERAASLQDIADALSPAEWRELLHQMEVRAYLDRNNPGTHV